MKQTDGTEEGEVESQVRMREQTYQEKGEGGSDGRGIHDTGEEDHEKDDGDDKGEDGDGDKEDADEEK
eukprot:5258552-Pyramimonas_sp.AAC.1